MWKQKFKINSKASGKTKESDITKISLFLMYIGEKAIEIYHTLFDEQFDPDDEDEEFADAAQDVPDSDSLDAGEAEQNARLTLKLVIQ